jgi:hypothetical protein
MAPGRRFPRWLTVGAPPATVTIPRHSS